MTEVDEVLASGGEAVSDQRNGAPHVAAHGGHVGALVTHRLHTLPGCLEGGGGGGGGVNCKTLLLLRESGCLYLTITNMRNRRDDVI